MAIANYSTNAARHKHLPHNVLDYNEIKMLFVLANNVTVNNVYPKHKMPSRWQNNFFSRNRKDVLSHDCCCMCMCVACINEGMAYFVYVCMVSVSGQKKSAETKI